MSVFAPLARCSCMSISAVAIVVRTSSTTHVTNGDAVVVTNVPLSA